MGGIVWFGEERKHIHRARQNTQMKFSQNNTIMMALSDDDNETDDDDDGDDYVLVNDDVLKQTFANVLNKLFDGAQPSEMSKISPHCMGTMMFPVS